MLNTLKNRKLSYAGHIMRNTSGHYDTLPTTIEGRLNGKRGRGRPRRTWVDDLRDWTGSKRYEQIKIAAETRRLQWKICNPHQWTEHSMNELPSIIGRFFQMILHKSLLSRDFPTLSQSTLVLHLTSELFSHMFTNHVKLFLVYITKNGRPTGTKADQF